MGRVKTPPDISLTLDRAGCCVINLCRVLFSPVGIVDGLGYQKIVKTKCFLNIAPPKALPILAGIYHNLPPFAINVRRLFPMLSGLI